MSKSKTSSRSRKHLNKSRKSSSKTRKMRGGNKPLSGQNGKALGPIGKYPNTSQEIKQQGLPSIRPSISPLYNPIRPINTSIKKNTQKALEETIKAQETKQLADELAKMVHANNYRRKNPLKNRTNLEYEKREYDAEIYATSIMKRLEKNPNLKNHPLDLHIYGMYGLDKHVPGLEERINTPELFKAYVLNKYLQTPSR